MATLLCFDVAETSFRRNAVASLIYSDPLLGLSLLFIAKETQKKLIQLYYGCLKGGAHLASL